MKKRMILLLMAALLVLSGCNPYYFSYYRVSLDRNPINLEMCSQIQDSNDIIESIENIERIKYCDNDDKFLWFPKGYEIDDCKSIDYWKDDFYMIIGAFGCTRENNNQILLSFMAGGMYREINKIKVQGNLT